MMEKTGREYTLLEHTPRQEPLGRGHAIWVNDAFTYGTDAVLLADFAIAEQKRAAKVADFGTGCGIIPFLCQTAPDCAYSHIDAVEIQPEGCALAQRTILENGWQEKISVCCGDVRHLEPVFEQGRYDLVTCNPPYGRTGGTLLNPTAERRIARHEQAGVFEEIAGAASKLLRYGGKFCVCQRPERLMMVMSAMRAVGIEPKTLRLVQYCAAKVPKLFLLSGRKGGKEGMFVKPTLLLTDEDGKFTTAYQEIRMRFAPERFHKNEDEK